MANGLEYWPGPNHSSDGELVLALMSRALVDLPTLCSAICVSKAAGQALQRLISLPLLTYRIGKPRCLYDGKGQALHRIAQQCFWLGKHADLILNLEVCSTVILDCWDNPISNVSARAAEDIICAALLHPGLKLQKLHLRHAYCPANIIQQLQHPNFLTCLSVTFHGHNNLDSNFCTTLGQLGHLQQLQLQCDSVSAGSTDGNNPAAFSSSSLAAAAFSPLLQLTKLSLGILSSAAAIQFLPAGLIWLEVAYLSTGVRISHMTTLETLILQNPDLSADELTAAVNSVSSLKDLKISYGSFISFAPESHAAAWSAMPKLRALHMWYSKPHTNSTWAVANSTQLCSIMYEDMAAAVQQCSGLTSLAIGYDCWQLPQNGAVLMLASLSHLQRLAIGVGEDKNSDLFNIECSGAAVLANISRLQALVLDVPVMSPVELQQLAAATRLTALQLSCDQVGDALLQDIANTNQQLRLLGVGGRCEVSLAAVEDLLSGTCLQHLEQLAVGPPKTNPFLPEHSNSVNHSNGAAATPPVSAWGFDEPNQSQFSHAYVTSYGSTTDVDSITCGDKESGWLDMLQEARPGVTVSSYVSLRFSNVVYSEESDFSP